MGKPLRKLLDPLLKWTLLLIIAPLSGCSVAGVAFLAITYQHEQAVGDGSLGASDRTIRGGSLPAPELAPDRRISEQDCTQPIDWSRGNLRCK